MPATNIFAHLAEQTQGAALTGRITVSQHTNTPPASEVADQSHVAHSEPIFHPVSTRKLLVLSFGTLGIYQYYWIYKNWQLHKQRTGENISPLPRAIFAIFFIYQLFKAIDQQTEKYNCRRIPAATLAIFWVVASLLVNLPDPYWPVTFMTILALVPVQRAVNELNAVARPGHDANTGFRGWNWVAVFVGLPIFAMGAMGALFFPEA